MLLCGERAGPVLKDRVINGGFSVRERLNSMTDDSDFSDVQELRKSVCIDEQKRHLLEDTRTSVHPKLSYSHEVQSV